MGGMVIPANIYYPKFHKETPKNNIPKVEGKGLSLSLHNAKSIALFHSLLSQRQLLFRFLHDCTLYQCTMKQFLYLFDIMRIFIRRIFTNHIFTYFLMNSINTSNSQNRFNLGQNILELATKIHQKPSIF